MDGEALAEETINTSAGPRRSPADLLNVDHFFLV